MNKKFLLLEIHEIDENTDIKSLINTSEEVLTLSPDNLKVMHIKGELAAKKSMALRKLLKEIYPDGFRVKDMIKTARKLLMGKSKESLNVTEIKFKRLAEKTGLGMLYLIDLLYLLRFTDEQLNEAIANRIGIERLRPIAKIKNKQTRSKLFNSLMKKHTRYTIRNKKNN